MCLPNKDFFPFVVDVIITLIRILAQNLCPPIIQVGQIRSPSKSSIFYSRVNVLNVSMGSFPDIAELRINNL